MNLEGEARVRLVDAQLVDLRLDGPYDRPSQGAGAALRPEPPGVFHLRRSITSGSGSRSGR
jgi:hypothetical protein